MIRSAFLIAAAALATLTVPAWGQESPYGDPPPLPSYEDGEWYEEWEGELDAGYSWDPEPGFDEERGERWREHDELHPPAPHVDYRRKRGAWLDECRRTYRGDYERCEDDLLRYERAYAAGTGYAHPGPGYGYYGGYPPVVWIRSPSIRACRERPILARRDRLAFAPNLALRAVQHERRSRCGRRLG